MGGDEARERWNGESRVPVGKAAWAWAESPGCTQRVAWPRVGRCHGCRRATQSAQGVRDLKVCCAVPFSDHAWGGTADSQPVTGARAHWGARAPWKGAAAGGPLLEASPGALGQMGRPRQRAPCMAASRGLWRSPSWQPGRRCPPLRWEPEVDAAGSSSARRHCLARGRDTTRFRWLHVLLQRPGGHLLPCGAQRRAARPAARGWGPGEQRPAGGSHQSPPPSPQRGASSRAGAPPPHWQHLSHF